jgi:hypothetical protein
MGEAHQLVRFFTADELAKNGRLLRAKLRQLRGSGAVINDADLSSFTFTQSQSGNINLNP